MDFCYECCTYGSNCLCGPTPSAPLSIDEECAVSPLSRNQDQTGETVAKPTPLPRHLPRPPAIKPRMSQNVQVGRQLPSREDTTSTIQNSLQSLSLNSNGLHHAINYDPSAPSIYLKKGSTKVVNNINFVSLFGSLKTLSISDPKNEVISKYIHNSSELESSQIKIHQIVEFALDSDHNSVLQTSSSNTKLLFWKTTPESVRFLAEWWNSCIPFYDRIASAWAVSPEDLREPLRQTILLCSVEMGRIRKSRHSYDTWKNRSCPLDCDSILATGILIPDPYDYEEIDGVVQVQLGKTKENCEFSDYEQNYNEYMIYDKSRLEIRYAVDLEVIPNV